MSKRGTLVADNEMGVMNRIMREYALLPPDRRVVVAAYVNTRLGELPVLAAVGGGTEDDNVPQINFPSQDKANAHGTAES